MKIPGSEFSSVNWMLRSNRVFDEFCCIVHQYNKSAARLISRPTQTVLAILKVRKDLCQLPLDHLRTSYKSVHARGTSKPFLGMLDLLLSNK